MTTDENLTPWFVNGEKPARKGVYNVSCHYEHQSGHWWSYWDGRRFLCFDPDKDSAKAYGTRLWADKRFAGAGDYVLTDGSWRGLAADPKGGAR